MKTTNNTVATLCYDLHVNGAIVESVTKENPLMLVVGAENILPGFTNGIMNLQEGDKFEFSITPENAYGEHSEKLVIDLDKKIFAEAEDGVLVEGNTLNMNTADGQIVPGVIVKIEDETVTMDFNHPMAGKTLTFKGEVLAVREATEEEIEIGIADVDFSKSEVECEVETGDSTDK